MRSGVGDGRELGRAAPGCYTDLAGGVAERFIAPVLKTGAARVVRGFESHPLRQASALLLAFRFVTVCRGRCVAETRALQAAVQGPSHEQGAKHGEQHPADDHSDDNKGDADGAEPGPL